VVRGVAVLFEIPAVVLVDRVLKWQSPSRVQARFFGYNWDGKIQHDLLADGFFLRRPGALMRATVFSRQPTRVRSGLLPIPDERAARHPFVEVSTVSPEVASTIVTVLAISRQGAPVPEATVESSGEIIIANLQAGDRTARCMIGDVLAVPEISVDS
jgi:hypothetical protein